MLFVIANNRMTNCLNAQQKQYMDCCGIFAKLINKYVSRHC